MRPEDLEPARVLIREVGAYLKEAFAKGAQNVELKAEQDYVSEVDRNAEDRLCEGLKKAYPQFDLVGEERGGEWSDNCWVIDPLDGTSNFLHGIPMFCTILSLVKDGEVVAGLTYDPIHDELFEAVKGHGATCNGKPMRVSGKSQPNTASVAFGVAYKHDLSQSAQALKEIFDHKVLMRAIGSAGLGLAYVASGRTECYWEVHLNPWDCLAGMLMVREAGGYSNPPPLSLKGGKVVACTSELSEFFEGLATS